MLWLVKERKNGHVTVVDRRLTITEARTLRDAEGRPDVARWLEPDNMKEK